MLRDNVTITDWQDAYALRDHYTIFRERFHRIEEVEGYKCLAVCYTPEIMGYLPPSELGLAQPTEKDLHRLLRMPVPVQVTEILRDEGIVLLSRKIAVERLSRRLWSTVEPGQDIEGVVVSPAIPGKPLFVETYGVVAEVPATELYWDHWISPKELKERYPMYSDVRGRVLEADRETGRLVLSLKALIPDPWETAGGKYREGEYHAGLVLGHNHSGAFVRLQEGIVCLCTKAEELKPGQRVLVKIKKVVEDRRKIYAVYVPPS
jgi:ribosomal protein S1